jgi:hypothetical protein
LEYEFEPDQIVADDVTLEEAVGYFSAGPGVALLGRTPSGSGVPDFSVDTTPLSSWTYYRMNY